MKFDQSRIINEGNIVIWKGVCYPDWRSYERNLWVLTFPIPIAIWKSARHSQSCRNMPKSNKPYVYSECACAKSITLSQIKGQSANLHCISFSMTEFDQKAANYRVCNLLDRGQWIFLFFFFFSFTYTKKILRFGKKPYNTYLVRLLLYHY